MKIIFSLLFTLLFSFSIMAQTRTAEVVVPNTFLRKSPNPGAEKVETVQRGEKVTLEKAENTNGWYYVSISSGKKGWINGNTVTSPVASEAPGSTPQPAVSAPKPVKQSKPVATPVPKSATTAPKSSPTPAPTPIAVPTPSAKTAPQASSVKPEASPTPAEDEEVLRVETEEVSLNVRVVDENNRPVNNLDESQFKVYENNQPQTITSFTTAEIPTNYALVVDNSRSLRTQLQKIIEAGKILISMNRPNDESTVVRFVSNDKIEVMRDFTSNKNLLNNALDNLFIEGGQTAIIDAVYQTAKRVNDYEKSSKKDDFKRRALIVISDGDDRSSTFSEQQLIDLLRQSEVQIYAIGFVGALNNQPELNETQSRQDKAKTLLTRLAEETGGKVYFPNSIDELPQIANDISSELRTQYLLTYSPTGAAGSESFRNIKVEVPDGANKEKRRAITRTGRTAAPEKKKQ